MIRTGFVLANTGGWTGGLVYLRNLIATLTALPEARVTPVLIIDRATPVDPGDFSGIEVIRTDLLGQGRMARVLRRASQDLTGRLPQFEAFLAANRIDVLSHSGFIGRNARVPAVAWLPDFQHVRMPQFFTADEVAARDRGYSRTAREAQWLILSSEDARADLSRFAPGVEARSDVLQFVAGMVTQDTRDFAALTALHGIDRPYFYLPNQFWAHKNHRLVVDALGLLAARGEAPLVVATGKTEDRRNPDHFAELMRHAESIGAAPYFKVLGLVPYADLSLLYAHAIAVVNPSHFEGWSTTVEEAKSLGKAVILSDIPVHREQAPARGSFVAPDDPSAMADALAAAAAQWNPADDARHRTTAAAVLPTRVAAFGRAFEDIVVKVARR